MATDIYLFFVFFLFATTCTTRVQAGKATNSAQKRGHADQATNDHLHSQPSPKTVITHFCQVDSQSTFASGMASPFAACIPKVLSQDRQYAVRGGVDFAESIPELFIRIVVRMLARIWIDDFLSCIFPAAHKALIQYPCFESGFSRA